MKKLLLITSLLVVTIGYTQSDNEEPDTVTYEMNFDDPKFTMLAGGLSYDLAINDYNLTLIGLGIDAVFMHERFVANLHSRYHLGEKITTVKGGVPLIESIYEPEHSMDFDLSGTYFFKSITKRKKQDVTLKSTAYIDYVTEIDTKVDTRYGLDLGFSKGFTYYYFGDDPIIGIDTEGNTLDIEELAENRGIATYFSQSTIRFGLSLSRISSFGAKFSTYGDKSVQKVYRFYLNGIYGINQQVDDVLLSDESQFFDTFTKYDISTNMTYSKFGIALGIDSYVMQLAKHFGVGYKIEIGIMPGPSATKFNNSYINFKFRFHIGGNFK